MIKRIMSCLAVVALSAGVAFADDGHKHAEGETHGHDHGAKHGGVVQHSGHHHIELVAEGGNLQVYVRNEEGGDEDASGAKASATVLAGGKTEMVTLAPAGGGLLKGSGGFDAGKGATVVVSLTMPGHEPEQVRFKLN